MNNTSPKPKPKKHYVDSKVLESHWAKWLDCRDQEAWKALLEGIYKICEGVAVHFNPKDEEEHLDLTHETFTITIAKIMNGKLKYIPGKAPVFNLLTTTIMRQLYSLKNVDSRRRRLYDKYKMRVIEEKYPEARCLLSSN